MLSEGVSEAVCPSGTCVETLVGGPLKADTQTSKGTEGLCCNEAVVIKISSHPLFS